eukprot:656314-Rhodomonas_salina.2
MDISVPDTSLRSLPGFDAEDWGKSAVRDHPQDLEPVRPSAQEAMPLHQPVHGIESVQRMLRVVPAQESSRSLAGDADDELQLAIPG